MIQHTVCIASGCTKFAVRDLCPEHAEQARKARLADARKEFLKKERIRRAKLGDKLYILKRFAAKMVAAAKRVGWLPLLDGTIRCVDCKEAATHWDHRDYSKPLEVDPVCAGCNVRRGPATTRMEWRKHGRANGKPDGRKPRTPHR